MSFVISPEWVQAAAQDLEGLRSALLEASDSTAAFTTENRAGRRGRNFRRRRRDVWRVGRGIPGHQRANTGISRGFRQDAELERRRLPECRNRDSWTTFGGWCACRRRGASRSIDPGWMLAPGGLLGGSGGLLGGVGAFGPGGLLGGLGLPSLNALLPGIIGAGPRPDTGQFGGHHRALQPTGH